MGNTISPRSFEETYQRLFQRGEGVVPRRQVAALLKRANIEFSQALQQTWDELDDPSIGGISFERWNRIIKSTIPRAKRIRTKKYFNLPRLQKEGLLDAPLIAVTGSEQLPDKTMALLLDCCDTSTTRVFLLEYACEPQEKTDDMCLLAAREVSRCPAVLSFVRGHRLGDTIDYQRHQLRSRANGGKQGCYFLQNGPAGGEDMLLEAHHFVQFLQEQREIFAHNAVSLVVIDTANKEGDDQQQMTARERAALRQMLLDAGAKLEEISDVERLYYRIASVRYGVYHSPDINNIYAVFSICARNVETMLNMRVPMVLPLDVEAMRNRLLTTVLWQGTVSEQIDALALAVEKERSHSLEMMKEVQLKRLLQNLEDKSEIPKNPRLPSPKAAKRQKMRLKGRKKKPSKRKRRPLLYYSRQEEKPKSKLDVDIVFDPPPEPKRLIALKKRDADAAEAEERKARKQRQKMLRSMNVNDKNNDDEEDEMPRQRGTVVMTGGCFEAAKASRHHREINEILPEVLHSGDDEATRVKCSAAILCLTERFELVLAFIKGTTTSIVNPTSFQYVWDSQSNNHPNTTQLAERLKLYGVQMCHLMITINLLRTFVDSDSEVIFRQMWHVPTLSKPVSTQIVPAKKSMKVNKTTAADSKAVVAVAADAKNGDAETKTQIPDNTATDVDAAGPDSRQPFTSAWAGGWFLHFIGQNLGMNNQIPRSIRKLQRSMCRRVCRRDAEGGPGKNNRYRALVVDCASDESIVYVLDYDAVNQTVHTMRGESGPPLSSFLSPERTSVLDTKYWVPKLEEIEYDDTEEHPEGWLRKIPAPYFFLQDPSLQFANRVEAMRQVQAKSRSHLRNDHTSAEAKADADTELALASDDTAAAKSNGKDDTEGKSDTKEVDTRGRERFPLLPSLFVQWVIEQRALHEVQVAAVTLPPMSPDPARTALLQELHEDHGVHVHQRQSPEETAFYDGAAVAFAMQQTAAPNLGGADSPLVGCVLDVRAEQTNITLLPRPAPPPPEPTRAKVVKPKAGAVVEKAKPSAPKDSLEAAMERQRQKEIERQHSLLTKKIQGNNLVCACHFKFGVLTGKQVIIDAITTVGKRKQLWKVKFESWLQTEVSRVMAALRDAALAKKKEPAPIVGLTVATSMSHLAAQTVSSQFLYGLGEGEDNPFVDTTAPRAQYPLDNLSHKTFKTPNKNLLDKFVRKRDALEGMLAHFIEEGKVFADFIPESDHPFFHLLVRDFVNVSLHAALFSKVFSKEDTSTIFKKHWRWRGTGTGEPVYFEANHAAGWFLHHLQTYGVRFVPSQNSFKHVPALEPMPNEIPPWHAPTRVGLRLHAGLTSINALTAALRAKANLIATRGVTELFQEFAIQQSGELPGLKRCVKASTALKRRVVEEVTQLLKKFGDKIPAYIPSTAELVNIVAKDLLRYKLVLPLNYVNAVKGLEKFLLEEGGLADCRFGGRVLWHNYWSATTHQTTYMGLNALVTVSRRMKRLLVRHRKHPVPNHGNLNHLLKEMEGFTMQLQIHTPRSHEIVQGKGHLIYEVFRNERCLAAVTSPREIGLMDEEDGPEEKETNIHLVGRMVASRREYREDVSDNGEQDERIRVRLRVMDPRPKRLTWKTQTAKNTFGAEKFKSPKAADTTLPGSPDTTRARAVATTVKRGAELTGTPRPGTSESAPQDNCRGLQPLKGLSLKSFVYHLMLRQFSLVGPDANSVLPGATVQLPKGKGKTQATRRGKNSKTQGSSFAAPDAGATLVTQKLCVYAGAIEEYGDATQWMNLRQHSAEHEQWLHERPKTMRKFDFFRSFLEGSKAVELTGGDPDLMVIDPLPKPPKAKKKKAAKKKKKYRVDNDLDIHLLNCARAGHVAAAETALARGARVNFQSVEELHSTPLLLACKNNRLAMVRLLLRSKANVEAADDFHWTPLMHAANRGLVKISKQLLGRGADPNYLVEGDGRHALSVAARQGRHKVASVLLEANADPDIRHTATNYNALLEACHYGQVRVIRAILKHHVDKINGMNAAVLEQMSLPKHKRKREYRMATMDDIELEKIWNLGDDIRDINQRTPLMIAANNGYQTVCEELLAYVDKKDDPNPQFEVQMEAVDDRGWNAEKFAVKGRHPYLTIAFRDLIGFHKKRVLILKRQREQDMQQSLVAVEKKSDGINI